MDCKRFVITEDLRNKILRLSEVEVHGPLYKELRASPEIVSLEGVEDTVNEWAANNWPGPFTEDVKARLKILVSDLRRLVAPVQPSAVVNEK